MCVCVCECVREGGERAEGGVHICIYVCVCVRERERGGEREDGWEYEVLLEEKGRYHLALYFCTAVFLHLKLCLLSL